MNINLKKLIPGFVITHLNQRLGRVNQYKGSYESWQHALSRSSGYTSQKLVNKVIESNTAVITNKARYERDGVIFDEISYAMELNACLLLGYIQKDSNQIYEIVDFGGSLGTTYRQFEEFTNYKLNFSWNIIEQEKLYEFGSANFENEKLRFYSSAKTTFTDFTPDIILFSAVLEFIEDFNFLLRGAISAGSEYIVFDRLPIWKGAVNHLSVLVAAKHISGSYPCWIFHEYFLEEILEGYELVSKWSALGGEFKFAAGNAEYIGMLWRKK
jgi:putative methyltransferase (TIGR04325 family)